MKKLTKVTALILSFITLISFSFPVFAVQSNKFVITSPYDDVDFSAVSQYKTALHTHTNASDGDMTLFKLIEKHVRSGFDIIAVTDHGTVNYSWTQINPNAFIYGTFSVLGKTEGFLRYLNKFGIFSDATIYKMQKNENGDDILHLLSGKDILRIPYGIENNAVSVNAHVNSWFVDYHDNSITTYEDAVKGIAQKGGVCVINHPGEYTKARYELQSKNAYNTENFSYNYYINKFASLIDTYDSCIGIDINSKRDERTRYDRILWDELLKRFSKNGDNVYAIASSDAHKENIVDTGYVYLLMNELTADDAENAIRNGHIFPASHCIGNYEELVEIADSIKEFYGETSLYENVMETVEKIEKKVADIKNGNEKSDSSIDYVYSVVDDVDGTFSASSQPMITSIETHNDKIEIKTENAAIVRFISNGKTFCTKRSDDAQISLSDYEDDIGDYVRAEVFGEGGIIYTEAFLINAAEKTEKTSVINGKYTDFGILDFLFAVFDNWKNVIEIFFGRFSRL